MRKSKKTVAEEIVLTAEQKEIIHQAWDKEDLVTVARQVFAREDIDNNSPEVKVIREYIAAAGSQGEEKTKKTPKYRTAIRLTEDQKVNIAAIMNNSDEPPTVREITLMLFPTIKNLTPLHSEFKAVYEAIREINEESISIWDEPVESRRYHPPVSYPALIGVVNRYVGNPNDPQRALYDAANIKSQHERNLKALLSYMRATRFVLTATQYDKRAERELFESTFIRQTHDKASGLLPEDVDMYISAAAEAVHVSQIERNIQTQENLINSTLSGEDDKEGSKAKLSMSLVESVNSLREKLDKAKGRFKGLIESVAIARSKRDKDKNGQNECLTNFVELWRAQQSRDDWLALGKKEHEEDAKEFGRIRDLDDGIALIAGMSQEEAEKGV